MIQESLAAPAITMRAPVVMQQPIVMVMQESPVAKPATTKRKKASSARANNKKQKLADGHGYWVYDDEELVDEIRRLYKPQASSGKKRKESSLKQHSMTCGKCGPTVSVHAKRRPSPEEIGQLCNKCGQVCPRKCTVPGARS